MLLIDCVPEPQLGGDTPVEVLQDVEAVSAFGRCGQPDELAWVEMLQQLLIREGRSVMELVNNYDVEVARVECAQISAG